MAPKFRSEEEVIVRVLSSINHRGRCWLWQAGHNGVGYGRINLRGEKRYVHRLVYEWTFGPIPDDFEVLHACDNPQCVNPAHLSVGTHRENILDMHRKGRNRHGVGPNALKTHCTAGHAFTIENTRISKEGWRYCRTCHRERNRRAS